METFKTSDGRTLAYNVVGTGPMLVVSPAAARASPARSWVTWADSPASRRSCWSIRAGPVDPILHRRIRSTATPLTSTSCGRTSRDWRAWTCSASRTARSWRSITPRDIRTALAPAGASPAASPHSPTRSRPCRGIHRVKGRRAVARRRRGRLGRRGERRARRPARAVGARGAAVLREVGRALPARAVVAGAVGRQARRSSVQRAWL